MKQYYKIGLDTILNIYFNGKYDSMSDNGNTYMIYYSV